MENKQVHRIVSEPISINGTFVRDNVSRDVFENLNEPTNINF